MNNALIYKILRWVTVLLAVIFLVNLCSDGKDSTTTATFEDLQKAVSMQVDTSVLKLADAEKVERFYGLKAENFANCMLYLPMDSMVYVEEVLLIEMSDASQEEAIRSAINERLQTQKNTFENYNLYGQYEKLCNDAKIEVCGNFLLFVIHSDAAMQAFLNTV